jgi:hypothetical protein
MINSRAPTLLRFNDVTNEFSFDLSEFDDNTLSFLHEYVQQYQTNTNGQAPPQAQRTRSRYNNWFSLNEPTSQEEDKNVV